jgi:hypothetical protein
MFAAAAYMWRQLLLLGQLIRLSQSGGTKIFFVVTRFSWDETGQRLTLDLPGATTEQERSTFQATSRANLGI